VTVGFMLPIDRALLVSEWPDYNCSREPCPTCQETHVRGHRPDCAHDLALSERGYPDQESRDRARALLKQAEGATGAGGGIEPVFRCTPEGAAAFGKVLALGEPFVPPPGAFGSQRFTAPRPVVEHCMGNDCSDKVACECMCPKCCPPV
jgi:hypothetical protein